MNPSGMTLIVKNTTRLVTGFIAVFAVYVALTGHLGPGGGFAGGVILAAAGVLIVLAFGKDFAEAMLTEPKCHIWEAAGAIAFILIALLGYFAGSFFFNFVNVLSEESIVARLHRLLSGGTIPISNLAILVKVGAGLAGAFLALSVFRSRVTHRETDQWAW